MSSAPAIGVLPGHRAGADHRAAAADHLLGERDGRFFCSILFCGVFYGAIYGGSTTSILLVNARRESFNHHLARRQSYGQGTRGLHWRPRRSAASMGPVGTLGIAFLGPWWWTSRWNSGRPVLPHDPVLRHRLGRAGRVGAARAHQPVLRAAAGTGRWIFRPGSRA